MAINIYQNTNASAYILVYSADHCENFEIKKSTGVIPFSLPIVDQTSETSGRMVTEQTEFIHIGGVEANISIDFDIGMSSINTMMGLVSNKMSRKHKVDVTDWAGETSGYTFIGIIDAVRIRQTGGDPRLTCNLTFIEGSNSLSDMDGL